MRFFFVSAFGNYSVFALVIFITLSVLIVFTNLTFLDTKQSGVQLVLRTHENITSRSLNKSKLHLNRYGSANLAKNFKYFFNLSFWD